MLFKPALIATVFAFAATPALANGITGPATPVAPKATAPAKPTPPPKPTKATPEQRAEIERLDPLARAAFWAREVDVDQTDADARLKLAKALRALGKYEEAGENADQLLVMQPTNYEALLESARDRIDLNHGFYAIDPTQRAAALQPRDWRPISLQAIALEQADRDSEALAAHQKALALAPNNPATLSNLGMYLATHGDPAQAEALLRRAVDAPGAGAQERQNLALVLGMEGHIDEAEHLERQDLPPQTVSNNLAYLRAATDLSPAGASTRTWDSVKTAQ
ncbi:MAG TPA: tetratricopeptide repeat protein [Caulobacteraceae bacterium]|jgi:Flp pilus assembly protein TadD|nr:tetratricopeptide repeat protein [Caulobacteraceae bacterium]